MSRARVNPFAVDWTVEDVCAICGEGITSPVRMLLVTPEFPLPDEVTGVAEVECEVSGESGGFWYHDTTDDRPSTAAGQHWSDAHPGMQPTPTNTG